MLGKKQVKAVDLERERFRLSQRRLRDILLTERRIAAGIFLVSLTAIFFLHSSTTPLTQSVPTSVTVAVYLTSLYIAWKKLLSGNKSTLSVNTARKSPEENAAEIRLANVGNSVINLAEIEFLICYKDEDSYFLEFSTIPIKEALKSGESTTVTVDHDKLVSVGVEEVLYYNWKDKLVIKRYMKNNNPRSVSLLDEEDRNLWGSIGGVLSLFAEQPLPYQPAMENIEISKEELYQKHPAEILNERADVIRELYFDEVKENLPYYEKKDAYILTPNSGGVMLQKR